MAEENKSNETLEQVKEKLTNTADGAKKKINEAVSSLNEKLNTNSFYISKVKPGMNKVFSKVATKWIASGLGVLLFLIISINVIASCSTKKSSSTKTGKVKTLKFDSITDDYSTLMSRAKEYENKQKFIYALGYYYDASECKNATSTEKQTAAEAFDDLALKLTNGTIGLREETVFGINDALSKIRFETYEYFTEFCPFEMTFSDIKQAEVDYDARTATYIAAFPAKKSAKYKKIYSLNFYEKHPAYSKDLWKVYRINESDFNDDISESIIHEGYIKNNIPFFYINNPEISDNILASVFMSYDPYMKKISYNSTYDNYVYFLDFSILDSSGGVIQKIRDFPCFGLQSIDVMTGTVTTDYERYDLDNRLLVRNVPAKYMADFEAGNIGIKLEGLYVPYGSFPYGEGEIENIVKAKRVRLPVRDNIISVHK